MAPVWAVSPTNPGPALPLRYCVFLTRSQSLDCGRCAWASQAWVLAKSKGPDLTTFDEAQTKTRSSHNDSTDDSQMFMKYAGMTLEERDPPRSRMGQHHPRRRSPHRLSAKSLTPHAFTQGNGSCTLFLAGDYLCSRANLPPLALTVARVRAILSPHARFIRHDPPGCTRFPDRCFRSS